jgi:hypothetical protein
MCWRAPPPISRSRPRRWRHPSCGSTCRWPLLATAILLLGWNAGLIANWIVLPSKDIRPGLVWPDLWRWQLAAPGQVLEKAGDLLFRRCGLIKNGC